MELYAWHNQYDAQNLPNGDRLTGVAGVILKHQGGTLIQEYVKETPLKIVLEDYFYPGQYGITQAARMIDRIGDIPPDRLLAVCINAEVEWESQSAEEMNTLCNFLKDRIPTTCEIWACVDTRGNRTTKHYQSVLGDYANVYIPMIYPVAFFPNRPADFVARAFTNSLQTMGELSNFGPEGKIQPVIQTYDGPGPWVVRAQVQAAAFCGCSGISAYTIMTATDEEWAALQEEVQKMAKPIDWKSMAQELLVRQNLAKTCLNEDAPMLMERLKGQISWLESQRFCHSS